jgi:hypothetical protein
MDYTKYFHLQSSSKTFLLLQNYIILMWNDPKPPAPVVSEAKSDLTQ